MHKLIFLLFLCPFSVLGQTVRPEGRAVRISEHLKIDGLLDESAWEKAAPLQSFMQFEPDYNRPTRQKMDVRLLFDDYCIYVGAMMYDAHPDSILHQLGNRDDDLNADAFTIAFDTYHSNSDAYVFGLTASGVQYDSRLMDETFNAVWTSAAHIGDSGWVAEMRIPYAALRFPDQEEQVWGMQIARNFRRFREKDVWAMIEQGVDNDLVYWGTLKGLNSIKAPLRLSFTPYLALYGQHFPQHSAGVSDLSGSYSGGLDLKWGVNESFTVDMTLLPDFSQVQSDNLVKNISAFETEYDDNRPFFNEGIDLFDKGGHFYSRRIGRTPALYDEISRSLNPGDRLIENPSQAKMLNATKFSGRGKNGTGIGIFNAITDNIYAVAEDSAGNTYRLLTEPLTNYNIFVFDQTLKNNSDVYLINTNVTRNHGWDDANVTGAGLVLNDKSNTWRVSLGGDLSQIIQRGIREGRDKLLGTPGYKYKLGFAKVKGNLTFSLERERIGPTFDNNDFGLLQKNDETTHSGTIVYSIYEPVGLVRYLNAGLAVTQAVCASTQKMTVFEINASNTQTFLNYLWLWDGIAVSPLHMYDYWEPREKGRFYRTEPYYYLYLGFSSDYRKVFALDGEATWVSNIDDPYRHYEAKLTPLVRASDRLYFTYTLTAGQSWNDKGYATRDSSGIIFGNRDLMSITQLLEARYMFLNNLSLSLRLRHYWSMGQYRQFYTLGDDGGLSANDAFHGRRDFDFNYNAFNLDLMFSWEFAPGSSLNITYKNAILNDENMVILDYWDNIRHTFAEDQLNSLSLKVLYYFDWQYLKKRRTA